MAAAFFLPQAQWGNCRKLFCWDDKFKISEASLHRWKLVSGLPFGENQMIASLVCTNYTTSSQMDSLMIMFSPC